MVELLGPTRFAGPSEQVVLTGTAGSFEVCLGWLHPLRSLGQVGYINLVSGPTKPAHLVRVVELLWLLS